MTEAAPKMFVQRLPQMMDRRIRIALEGLAFSMQSIAQNVSEISVVLDRNISEFSADFELEDAERLRIFTYAWSIIDRLDCIRVLLKSQRQFVELDTSHAIYEHLGIGRRMRNKMDHLGQQIGNLSKRDVHVPVFGVITVASFPEAGLFRTVHGSVTAMKQRRLIVIPASAFQHQMKIDIPSCFDNNVYVKFGYPVLHAFDEKLNLNACSKASLDALARLDTAAEEAWGKAAVEAALKSGKPLADYYESLVGPADSVVQQDFDWTPINLTWTT